MQAVVYHSQDIQAWEQRWFAAQNSSLGLMQQAAWSITQQLIVLFQKQNFKNIAVWCGQGNNAGDGYFIASYLKKAGFQVEIFAADLGESTDLHHAVDFAKKNDVQVHQGFEVSKTFDCHIDALFGIGLNRELNGYWQHAIQQFNGQAGLKISIDIPSGLHANTGSTLSCAIRADHTFTVLGLKAGLFTGQGKEYAGQIHLINLIPIDQELQPLAYLTPTHIKLPKRLAFGHKGSYGHVLVIGGHEQMGGAVIMAAEAAFHAGAGKVTVVCHSNHHQAILSRAPNIMLRDINDFDENGIKEILSQVDAVCFGMGLGRDEWAHQIYQQWFNYLNQTSHLEVVLDADALWFLAKQPEKLSLHIYATPHPGEAATLLGCSTWQIENDRIAAIYALQQKYAGQWVLKGAGSLILEDNLYICTQGNAGMGTGGMGDVLAGMIASLKAQFHKAVTLHEIVTLHAQAGDQLAKQGMRGLQAYEMNQAITQVVNQ
ncbi:TPA: bifunctional ADP-dependent NAD(P)H-hydrate dehydratase/NAD(P)H-hydrate epimerase [Acinetobacter baumannii]|uniref:bifunctional ADP-dependent NAD(P)H-hydrate dehydratase/NAD(P)H-hydrate epimerase n=1 Tax=Acinetobacter baumannii TaxID=470 RepID=UPI000810ACF1|nr:bifunctional ADP-dependent NAD(P)H-hydrate dehydratase/NAD(P)H-hydrate epimerase [Acinetobacter baumannii]EKU5220922.1 bifunctional ADP-dependent NAD(P)H-hydrate dehydratase/NAD(P)H-hydrate epimerase [Acinetobacter baumannii]EKU6959065.1 bifunctional ADP-dependent NAD(P)H-hydrate dehydratase/NAD(P)H-hydrate epimerase [Acinetobacter baumannii]EKV0069660.1 bifunctional ADP-dependent NAD(P)H-hydrate dehydratase/NAD(P)H-hydrate epimerase [Acinetobacter baumannii]EKV0073117.1 bifunctional ADP-dep